MKLFSDRRMWYAIATLVGSTVGVGLYGIPFAVQKATFGVGFLFFIFVGGMVLITNLLYGEVILRTHQRHQFVGYVRTYLGPWAKRINTFNFWIAVYGALTGIIIISGDFLAVLFGSLLPFSPLIWSTIFIVVASCMLAGGLKTIARFDFLMMFVFGIVLVSISGIGSFHLNLSNFNFGITRYWFLPFGVLLFAMNGITGIPLMREMLIGSEGKMKKSIIVGTTIPLILFFIFTLVVVGVSGETVSPDAVSGLRGSLGAWIVVVGSLFGFMTSSTIFLNLGTALKESLHQDFHFNSKISWIFVSIVPYALFLSGVRNFIDVIGLVGGVAVSIDSIILIFIYVKARKKGKRMPEYSFRVPNFVLYLLMLLFVFGALYTLFST